MNTLLDPAERAQWYAQDGYERAAQQMLEALPELRWLLQGQVTPEAGTQPKKSAFLPTAEGEGVDVTEFDKGINGLLMFFLVLDERYDVFVAGQPENVRLTRCSFDELRALVKDIDRRHVRALAVFLALNDLGKTQRVVEMLRDQPEPDHDVAMGVAFHRFPTRFPSLGQLSQDERDDMVRTLMSGLLFAQLQQGEATPYGITDEFLRLAHSARRLLLLHSLFDVAGAVVSRQARGSVVYTEPYHHSAMLLYRGLLEVRTRADAARLYRQYACYRCSLVAEKSATQNRDERIALGRLAAMRRRYTRDNDLVQALRQFAHRTELVRRLARGRTLIYYAPAIVSSLPPGEALEVLHILYGACDERVRVLHAAPVVQWLKDPAQKSALLAGRVHVREIRDGHYEPVLN